MQNVHKKNSISIRNEQLDEKAALPEGQRSSRPGKIMAAAVEGNMKLLDSM